jgi:YD repeat-containing protein
MVGIVTGFAGGLERSSYGVLGSAGMLGQAHLGRGPGSYHVNATTGELHAHAGDQVLLGRGPDAAYGMFTTSYVNEQWRLFGHEAVYNGSNATPNTEGHSVARMSSEWVRTVYHYDAARGVYLNKEGGGAYDEIRFANGQWTWTDGNTRLTEAYGADGKIVSRTDKSGNVLTISRLEGNVTMTTADGSSISFVQVSPGLNRIEVKYTGADGVVRTTSREWLQLDSQYRITSVTVDMTPDDNSIADGKVFRTNYEYDAATSRLSKVTQTDGTFVEFGRDASGRVNSITEGSGMTAARTTTLTYNSGMTAVTDALGQVTELHYDASGQLTKIVSPPLAVGAQPQTRLFGYNANGDVVSVTDANGNADTFEHDDNGNVITARDASGGVVTRIYGAQNQLLTETVTGSDSTAAEALHTTRFVYDASTRLRYRVGADGDVTEYRYKSTGEIEYTIEYPEHFYNVSSLQPTTALTEAQLDSWRNGLDRSSSKITQRRYDARGNLTEEIRYESATAAGAPNTSGGSTRTAYLFDPFGQLVMRQRAGQGAETFAYDGLGRLVASTDLNGGSTSITFNDAGSQSVVTLANGFVTTSTYNNAGDLISSTEAGSYVVGGTATNKYDKLGRLRMTTDATGLNKYYVYDKIGRLAAEILHDGAAIEYRYDAEGRLAATFQFANHVSAANLVLLADPAQNPEFSSMRPGYGSDICTWRFYDKEGRVAATMDSGGNVRTMEYDKAGRLVRTMAYANRLSSAQVASFKTTPPAAVVLPTADALRDSVSRNFYDKDGALAAVLDGEGYLTRFIYDHAGQKIEEISYLKPTSTTHRATGTLASLISTQTVDSANDRRTRFAYDGRGLLRYEVDSLNQVTEFAYNSAGKLTNTIAYAGAIAATSDYTFDNVKALVASAGLASSVETRRSWIIYDRVHDRSRKRGRPLRLRCHGPGDEDDPL